MTYDKKDLPKIIILAAVLLAVIVYIGVRSVSLSAKLKAAHQAEHQALQAQAQAQRQAALAASSQVPSSVAAFAALVPPPVHDPFDPVIPPRRRGSTPAQAAPRAPEPASNQDRLPLLPMLPPPGGETSSGAGASTISVTGIIVGTPSLAVLRQGEDHFIVHAGDQLGDGVRVSSITRTTVTLSEGRRQYVLRLGD